MSGFLDIQRIIVPRSAIGDMMKHLGRMGESELGAFSLWAGRQGGTTFHVCANIVPEQTGYQSEGGVGVSVAGEELHRLNVWLYQNKMSIIAQIHTHPGDAYHSDTDDAFPIATTVGSVSIVIPDFAQRPFSVNSCATYRLSPKRQWVGLSPEQAALLIQITAQ